MSRLAVTRHADWYVLSAIANPDGAGRVTRVCAPGGQWIGHIGTKAGATRPPGARVHNLAFEFQSPDFFIPGGRPEHFAIGIRGRGDRPVGRGIVIGTVTDYPAYGLGCGPTAQANTIAIESFWDNRGRSDDRGNCVYGASSESPPLACGVRYRLLLQAADVAPGDTDVAVAEPCRAGRIGYTLWRRSGATWQALAAHAVLDRYHQRVSPDLGGLFIASSGPTARWSMHLYQVRSWWD